MTTVRDIAWWYWLVTAVLLGIGLLWGQAEDIILAIVLCAVQIIHVYWLTRSWTSFPMQVRMAYPALLLAGLWEPLYWIHWIQLIGTSARVLAGYCFLARTLSLAPWNRWQPMSVDLIRKTYFSIQTTVPPCGEVFRRMSLERVQA